METMNSSWKRLPLKSSDSEVFPLKKSESNESVTEWRQRRRESLKNDASSTHSSKSGILRKDSSNALLSKEKLHRKESSDTLLNNSGAAVLSRRRSTLKSITQSISGILELRRLTLTKARKEEFKQEVRVENTYKMSPEEENVFNGAKVKQVAEEVMEKEIRDTVYDPAICGELACDLAVKIKRKVKDLNFPRYKIVCHVTVGQVGNQGLEAASRCVWDPKTDNFVCVSYRNGTIFAIALIHAVYFE